MFEITMGKGFTVTFANEVTVSVQWGSMNYCDNYTSGFRRILSLPISEDIRSATAEVAVWYTPGNTDDSRCWLTREWDPDLHDDVAGWQTPAQVLDLMAWAESRSQEWLDAFEYTPYRPDWMDENGDIREGYE